MKKILLLNITEISLEDTQSIDNPISNTTSKFNTCSSRGPQFHLFCWLRIIVLISLLPFYELFASFEDNRYTISEVYETSPIVFIGTVLSIDSMYFQTNPVMIFKGDSLILENMMLSVPVSYHNIRKGDEYFREAIYSNPFTQDSDYLFFVDDYIVKCYGTIGDGFFLLNMFHHYGFYGA